MKIYECSMIFYPDFQPPSAHRAREDHEVRIAVPVGATGYCKAVDAFSFGRSLGAPGARYPPWKIDQLSMVNIWLILMVIIWLLYGYYMVNNG